MLGISGRLQGTHEFTTAKAMMISDTVSRSLYSMTAAARYPLYTSYAFRANPHLSTSASLQC